MKRIGTLLTVLGLVALTAAPALATNEGVCSGDKVDTTTSITSITIEAPEGFLIVGYCVKAGSINQDLGPEYFTIEPATSVTFGHSSGKDISHYSVSLVEQEQPTTTTTSPSESTTTTVPVTVPTTTIVVTSSTTEALTVPTVTVSCGTVIITGGQVEIAVNGAPTNLGPGVYTIDIQPDSWWTAEYGGEIIDNGTNFQYVNGIFLGEGTFEHCFTTTTAVPQPKPTTPTELPFTGPADNFWPMAGWGAFLLTLGMATLTLVRRLEVTR